MGPVEETIGQRLRRLRLERGFSQRELSGPGVSYAYISRIEAGERRPSVKALRVLALNLGVSADYLETGADIRADEERELRLADAELELRLAESPRDAEPKLESILEEALLAGDTSAAARARIALGLAAAQADRHDEAVARLEGALAEAPMPPHARPDVYATLGRSYAAIDRFDDSIALFELCLARLTKEAPQDTGSYVRFASYLSFALTDCGQLARAEQVMKGALKRASGSPDPYTRVRVYWSLARLVDAEGRPDEALDYIRRAIALLEATDDTLHLARAHLLSAFIMLSQGDADAAGEQLALAEARFGISAEPVDRGMMRAAEAKCAVLRGEGARAVTLAREALADYGEHHLGDQGQAWQALAEGLALEGADAESADAYHRAIELLGRHGRTREASDAQTGLDRLLASPGGTRLSDVLAHGPDAATES